jgi:ferredoxin
MEDREKRTTPRLLSVNVGLPRDVAWRGKTVHTGIWKTPVKGRRIVRRLNIDGDGQGDLAGHGGGPAGVGPLVSFARSGLNVRWAPAFQSLLELAEACDVPVRWACRTGVCHTCETGLISGGVGYRPEPLEPPADGNALICCSRPQGDIVIDL